MPARSESKVGILVSRARKKRGGIAKIGSIPDTVFVAANEGVGFLGDRAYIRSDAIILITEPSYAPWLDSQISEL